MSQTTQGVTLLWALRSPCNLNCQYCYFGTLGGPQDRSAGPSYPGELSHVGCHDLSLFSQLRWISSFTPALVHRVFVAGGEPLIWKGTGRVLKALKEAGCKVIVCTNGLPLRDETVVRSLLEIGVDAVSISLDSHDAAYHDHWRQDRSGQGWLGVVEGVRTLVSLRNAEHHPMKIGIYSVITQLNIDHILPTARYVADLGVDYFIIQPISLTPDHAHGPDLMLDARHQSTLAQALEALQQAGLSLHLPHPGYLKRVLQTLMPGPLPVIQQCFGGRDLFFIEPDGSVWDCPSCYKIAQTPTNTYLSIRDYSATELFSVQRRQRNTDCACFSQECVNMWQLMAFDQILAPGGSYDTIALPASVAE